MRAPRAAAPQRRGTDRRADIIKASRAIFLERGYAGASTDAIVERSGGSKETIYSHFGSKLGLFRAVLLAELALLFAPVDLGESDSLEEALRSIGRGYARAAISEESLRLGRMVLGEIERVPDLGRQLYAAGPEKLVEQIAVILRRHQERGTIRCHDPLALAETYVDLRSGRMTLRAVFDPTFRPTVAEIDAHVERCITSFSRLIAAADSAANPR